MTDEKMIEELAKEINNAWAIKPNGDIFAINEKLNKNDIEMLAHQLVLGNYRKLPENAVVLTKEEHERLTSRRYFLTPKRKLSPVEIILAERNNPFVVVPENMDIITIPSEDEIRKETARKIITEMREFAERSLKIYGCIEEVDFEVLCNELAEKCGVEIEE